MEKELRPKTLLTIGYWPDCENLLTLAISNGWSALYTPQFDDIPAALNRQRVAFIFLVGRCPEHDWERTSTAAWAINPDIPIIAIASISDQSMLINSLLGTLPGASAHFRRESGCTDTSDLSDGAGIWRRSGLTPTLMLLEPCSSGVSLPIRQSLAYIATNYGDPITLDDVARSASYSRCHFCKVFKEQIGMSFITYLNRIRIKSAMDLLVRSTLSITEIAVNVGFNDLSHFERVFRASYHDSPSRYRQNTKYLPCNIQI
jgi:AraC-like DNA-binding protein